MPLTRREMMALSGAAVGSILAAAPGGERLPWYRTMRRCGQVNFNERDPLELNVDAWLDYWASLKINALLLNAGGIVAFYPTRIPYHHKSQYLNGSDLFGRFAAAAKRRGIRVVARLDCNYAWEEAWKAHPEWFERVADGGPRLHDQSPWLRKTCMYSSYFTEQMPAIIREVNSLYDVDGFFTNGWPGAEGPSACHCAECRAFGDPHSPEFRDRHLARILEVWKLWDSTARQKKWDSVYVGNLGGGIRASTDLRQIAAVAGWFNADHQGRAGNTPIWDCAQQGRVAQCVMKGRTITNVTGSYANSHPLWRHTSKAPEEATMWMAQTTASGMVPWYHWLGGAPQDLRWRETGRSFFDWIARNERHFVNRRSIANLGVVFSQRGNAFYKPPGGNDPTEFLQGLYYALLESRFPFDFVHEDDLAPETLGKYTAVLLPNVALLSDAQCRQLEAYAQNGGSLLATFETGLFDERGNPRSDFGLAKLFGIEKAGTVQGPEGNSYYARILRQHDVLRGFENTSVLPGAEYRVPVRAAETEPVLAVLPPYPAFPPEMVYPRAAPPKPPEPAMILREQGGSRLAYIPGDIDRSFWRSGNPDLSRLLSNTVRWLLHDRVPVTVEGAGMVEVFAWETEPGFALHVLNYTNPNMLRGWFTSNYPVGPLEVRAELPEGVNGERVELLRAATVAPLKRSHHAVTFTIPTVRDYEVAVIGR
ncbi:MAG TPA: alpha-amylase family protein [Bryobacteraceae bacterium]|nr:alpha-amylase family protein [Bryobacteraceae bacterium]